MLNINKFTGTNFKQVELITNGLDKAIEVTPLYFDVGGVKQQTDKWKGIYNVTQGEYCKTVSTSMYKLIGHKEFLDTFSTVLDRLNVKYSMNIISVGNTVFTDIEFAENKVKFDKLNEEFIVGIRLINSYDRNYPITIMPRLKRLACLNGMILTRDEKSFNVKHSCNLAKEIEKLIEIKFNEIVNSFKNLQVLVEESIADSIEWKLVGKIMEKIIKQPKHLERILQNLNINVIKVLNPITNKDELVFQSQMADGVKINRWQLYNAITQYLTHGEQLSPYVENAMQAKAEKLLNTPLIEVKL